MMPCIYEIQILCPKSNRARAISGTVPSPLHNAHRLVLPDMFMHSSTVLEKQNAFLNCNTPCHTSSTVKVMRDLKCLL